MNNNISITKIDLLRLKKIINDEMFIEQNLNKLYKDLDIELSRANVFESKQISNDIITMNSRAIISINGEAMEVSLVYPEEADLANNKLSVISPIGVAILGYKEGDKVNWEVPAGTTEIKIEKIIYQPESAGDFHL